MIVTTNIFDFFNSLVILVINKHMAPYLIIHTNRNQNGVLVPNGDELGFVNASVELALDLARQQQMRERAPQSVAHLAWSAVSDSFEAVLRDVLAQHGQPFSPVIGALPGGLRLPAQQSLAHPHLGSLH